MSVGLKKPYSRPDESPIPTNPMPEQKKTRANPCFSEQFVLSQAASCSATKAETISSPTM